MFNSAANNYGSSITAKPYGGPIARSLTSRSATPSTGNATRDAMTRAMSDQTRNASEQSREAFENKFNQAFQQARASDVMSLRGDEFKRYQLDKKKEVDDASRKLREDQNMKQLAFRLQSQKASDKWGAISDYTSTFLSPLFLSPERGGVIPSLYDNTLDAFLPSLSGQPSAVNRAIDNVGNRYEQFSQFSAPMVSPFQKTMSGLLGGLKSMGGSE